MREQKSSSLSDTLFAKTPPQHMQLAIVSQFDCRRGSGRAIVKSTGRKVRIPLSALRAANVVVLSPGDTIYLAVDHLDKARAEAIWVP